MRVKMKEFAKLESTVSAHLESRELGDLFEYRFDAPVTIRKNESAMLPFLQQKIAARKLLIYSESYGQNPMSAAELTNNTGKTLDGGPITIFESAGYGGEALMNTTKNADKRLISYAVDLGTRIGTKEDSGDAPPPRSARQPRRDHEKLRARHEDVHYPQRRPARENASHRAALRQGYTPVNPKPSETTANARRYEVKLPPMQPRSSRSGRVRLLAIHSKSPASRPTCWWNTSARRPSPKTAASNCSRCSIRRRASPRTNCHSQQAHSEMNEASSAQDRLRQNIQTLNHVNGQQEQVQEWSKQLAAEEVRMTVLRDRTAALDKKKASLEAELGDMIGKLEF